MTLKAPSQKDRILRLARSRGETGICQVDFLAPDVADGREPITRLAARIADLEEDGFTFTRAGRRHRCQVYVLVSVSPCVSVSSDPSSPVPAETPRLAGLADTHSPLTLLEDRRSGSAIYGDDAA